MKFYANKDKSIMCPNCRKFLTKANSKDPRTHKLACKHCHKWIWYVPNDDDNFQIKEIPDSRSSSGMTFIRGVDNADRKNCYLYRCKRNNT